MMVTLRPLHTLAHAADLHVPNLHLPFTGADINTGSKVDSLCGSSISSNNGHTRPLQTLAGPQNPS